MGATSFRDAARCGAPVEGEGRDGSMGVSLPVRDRLMRWHAPPPDGVIAPLSEATDYDVRRLLTPDGT